MKAIVLVYTELYGLLAVGLLMAEFALVDEDEKHPPLEKLLDVLFLSLGFCGLVLFLGGTENDRLRDLWKPVTVILVLGQLFLNLRDRNLCIQAEGNQLDKSAVRFTDTVTLLFLVPSLLVNALFAFGPSLK